MPIDPKYLGNDRYSVHAATDEAPPVPGMDPAVWRSMRHMIAAAVLTNMAQIAVFLAERESEAEAIATQHAACGQDCAMGVLTTGLHMGLGAALASVRGAMAAAAAGIPADMARAAQQAGERIAQGTPGFHANPDALEAAIRGHFEAPTDAPTDAAPVRPVRPRSPRDGGTIH